MSLHEALARTLADGDLRQSDIEESGADRVAALGLSDRLGAALIRVLAEHDRSAFIESGRLLAAKLRRVKVSRESAYRVAAVVIHEWLADKCRKCGGRGFIFSGEVKRVCTTCLGLGYRRPSDAERMRALGVDRRIYGKLEPAFAVAGAALTDALARASRQLRRQLDRYKL